jgi:hypothetical protein
MQQSNNMRGAGSQLRSWHPSGNACNMGTVMQGGLSAPHSAGADGFLPSRCQQQLTATSATG